MPVNAPGAVSNGRWYVKPVQVVLFLSIVFALYMANHKVVGFADTIPTRYLPLSIIREGNFDLDEFSFLHAHEALLYPVQYRNGHFLSFPPVGVALLATPFYAVPAWLGISPESPRLPLVEKSAAAGIAALSGVWILLTLMAVVPSGIALLTAGLYAFGTTTFGVSSQALWPIGGAQFLLALGIYCLHRGLTASRYTAYAALPLAWAVICRPSMALVSLLAAVYVWRRQPRQFLRFLLWASPAVAFLLMYNLVYFGEPFLPPGYVSPGGHVLARPENFSTPIWKGLLGLLISPAVGFLVYSPVFLLALVGMSRQWRARDPLTPYLLGMVLCLTLLNSMLNMWWGGTVYGPRYMAEVVPVLAYFLAFSIPRADRVWKVLSFGLLALWSVYANGLVAVAFDGSWDRQARLWAWTHSPLVYYSRQAFDRVRSVEPALARYFGSLPDSRGGVGLAANFQGLGLPQQISTHAYIDVDVQVQNAGHAVWRRQTVDAVGTVRLGWRWLRTDEPLTLYAEGRAAPLPTDVLPGRRIQIASRLWAPAEPGRYVLEFGMVSEAVGWFGVDGGPPLRMSIEVTGAPLCDWQQTLATLADPTQPPLYLQWMTDRERTGPHEAMSLRLDINNPGPARVFYPVIVLQRPSGVFAVLDLERQTFVSLCSRWLERTYPMFLDRGYRATGLPLLSLLSWKMPVGHYKLFFLFLHPRESRMRLAGVATVDFERIP